MSLDSLSIELTSEGMQPTTTIHLHQSALIKTTIGAMMISFSAVWVRLAQVAPTVSAFYRVGFGAVFLLAILAFRRESLWRGWSVLGLSLIAGLFFALDLYAWHRCIGYVGPGLATILGNFEVFLVPVVGLLLYKERLSLRFVLAVPLAIVGLFMIVGVRWDQLSQDYRIGIGWGLAGYCPGTTWAAAGEGRIDAVFALLGGLAGTALFAQLHETLIPLLYDPTNVGQITLTDFFGNYAVAVAVLAVGFGVCTWIIGKLWAAGDRVVAFERGPDPDGSAGHSSSEKTQRAAG
mgnify:CR=1 FL=1